MRLKKALLVFLISTANLTYSQIKIGDNPQNINQSSVLELESTSRALVITRVSTTQMNAITPLQGAMVYNIDTQCIHYYNGSEWLNLCDALANSVNISLVDNGDGTYTFSDANNNLTEINNLNESLVVEDGNLILTDTSGNAISVELQNLSAQTFTTDAIINTFPTIFITQDATGTNFNFEVGVIDGESIQDGSIKQIDLAGASVGSAQLRDNSVGNLAIADNAVGTLEIINGSVQPIDLGPGNTNQILTTNGAGAVQWVDQTGLVSADEVTYNNAISNLTANNVQEALDEVTNNINTLTIGDILTQGNDAANQNIRNVTDPSLPQDAATKNYVDQAITAGTADGSETILNDGTNINITGTGTSGSPYIINNTFTEVDGSLTNEIQSLSQVLVVGNAANNSITNLTNPVAAQDAATKAYVDAQVGGSAQVIVSGNTPNSIIPGTDGGALYNDGDSDDSNELSDLVFNPGTSILTLSNSATPANSVDLSSLSGTGTDDQNLTGASLSGTILQIDIENGNSATVDLGTLSGVDTDDQTLSLSGNEISISEGNTIDLTPILGTGGTDDQQLVLAGNILTLEDGGTPIDLTPFLDDTDDQTITDFTFNNATNILTLTIDGGNTDTADLSALAGGGNPAASDVTFTPIGNTASNNVQLAIEELQTEIDGISGGGAANPNDELITSFTLTGTNLNIAEGANILPPVDLDPEFTTDAELAAAIATSEALDNDTNATNELQTITSPDASVTVTPVGNNYELTVAGSTDDQNLGTATLSGTDLTINIEGGNPTTADLVTLATDIELGDAITASEALDNDTNSTNELQTITSPDASVTVTPVGNNYELTVAGSTDNQNIQGSALNAETLTIGIQNGTSEDVNLSTFALETELASAITASEALDLDKDDSNEIQVLSLTGNDLALSNGGGTVTLTATSDGVVSNMAASANGFNVTGANGGFNGSIDLDPVFATDAQLTSAVTASEALDLDKDDSNEIQVLSLTGNDLALSNGGGTVTLTATSDGVVSNMAASANGFNVTGANGGFNGSIDLDPVFATDAQLTSAITASEALDLDKDDSNEIQVLSLTGNDLALSNGGGTVTLTATSDGVVSNMAASANGFNVTGANGGFNGSIDLDPVFATDAQLASAITASEALDLDKDDSNEIQVLSLTGNDLALSNGGGTVTLTATSDGVVSNMAASANGFNVTGANGGFNGSIDLDPVFATDAQLTSAITASEALDLDKDDSNEIQVLSLTGNDLALSNGGGTVTLTATSDGVVSNMAASANGFNVTGANGGFNGSIDLDPVFATDAQLASAITASEALDLDKDDSNEIQVLSLTGNDLALSNGGGTVTLTNTGTGNLTSTSLTIGGDTNALLGNVTIEIPPNSITQGEMANNSVGAGEIRSDAVSSDEIDDDSIFNVDINSAAAISGTKINPNFGAQPVVTTGTLDVGNTTITGDLNVSNTVTVAATVVHPDYVFQKYFLGNSILNESYDFQSLAQIEDFVKKYHHLPGIKSASEVQKDGFWNLSESNLQNLEKIEELFLHTIEQEKKIQELKSENIILSKELNSLKNDLEEIKVLLKKD